MWTLRYEHRLPNIWRIIWAQQSINFSFGSLLGKWSHIRTNFKCFFPIVLGKALILQFPTSNLYRNIIDKPPLGIHETQSPHSMVAGIISLPIHHGSSTAFRDQCHKSNQELKSFVHGDLRFFLEDIHPWFMIISINPPSVLYWKLDTQTP